MQFSDLRLSEPILRAVAAEGYTVASPIQAQAIPHVLAGKDVLGSAQTGTGKTAAFALPILQRLSDTPLTGGPRVRCLVLSPTRELALQIAESFKTYGKNLKIRQACIFGGVGQNPQVNALRNGTDVIVATPGRLLDLVQQGHSDFRGVEVLVLDEADRMLDMGFINDIRKIVSKLPAQRQTLMFSATMPPEIRQLAQALLKNPVSVQVAPVAQTADKVDQSVYFVDKRNKPVLLAHLVNELPMTRAIVFTRTKHGADRVVRHLQARGIRSEAIHGNKSQNARERALANFKSAKIPVLVATDIAARGIDVDGITHVVNYDLTHEPETYVHRIGRTARAGAGGAAVSFCDSEERVNLQAIQRLIRLQIPVKTNHPVYPTGASAHSEIDREPRRDRGGQRSEGGGRRGGAERQPARHPSSREHAEAAQHSPRASSRPADPRRSHAAAQPAQNHAPRPQPQHQSQAGQGNASGQRRPQAVGKGVSLAARHPLFRQSTKPARAR